MSKRRNTKPEYYTQREWNRIQARERAQAKASRNLVIAVIILLLLVSLMVYAAWFFVIRSHDTGLPVAFDESSNVFGFHTEGDRMARAVPFADGLCVTDSDVDADAIFISATEGALFDINSENVVYAKNIFEQRSPASITKIMTALVALKYANPDDMVTVTQSAFDIEEASSVCELHLGDRLTLKQLLYGLLIASGNEAAQMIAE